MVWKGCKPGSVLCAFTHVTVICLEYMSPRTSSGCLRNSSDTGHVSSFLLAAFEPCIRWGLPSRDFLKPRWWSLTPPFQPYLDRSYERQAVYFLLHFPSASRLQNSRVTTLWFVRCPAVSWHLALRCPDFPHTLHSIARALCATAPLSKRQVYQMQDINIQLCFGAIDKPVKPLYLFVMQTYPVRLEWCCAASIKRSKSG